jgi:hypothetical protein
MKTKVIFRTFHSGDTIALFPEIPHDAFGVYCVSYQRIGQHGAASPDLSPYTRPSKPDEIRELREELRRVGYTDLQPIKRVTAKINSARRAAAKSRVLLPHKLHPELLAS